MPNIKSEVLAQQECSKKKVFLKILQNSLKATVCRSLFYNEGAADMDKSNF